MEPNNINAVLYLATIYAAKSDIENFKKIWPALLSFKNFSINDIRMNLPILSVMGDGEIRSIIANTIGSSKANEINTCYNKFAKFATALQGRYVLTYGHPDHITETSNDYVEFSITNLHSVQELKMSAAMEAKHNATESIKITRIVPNTYIATGGTIEYEIAISIEYSKKSNKENNYCSGVKENLFSTEWFNESNEASIEKIDFSLDCTFDGGGYTGSRGDQMELRK
jgi:hypothetical protein